MRNKTVIFGVIGVVVVAAIILTVVFAGNSKAPTTDNMGSMNMNTGNSTSNSSSSDQNPVATTKVTISNFSFSPAAIKVKVGDTVTWTNQDEVGHTVTADNSSTDAPASDLLSKGQSYSFTFKKAGTYTYHCTPHPYMKGTVIVE